MHFGGAAPSLLGSPPIAVIVRFSTQFPEGAARLRRNRGQAAKAESAEITLLEKKGTLISRQLAGFQGVPNLNSGAA